MEKIKMRKSIMENMKVFSPQSKESDFIEVTEWTNGEGWDITINDNLLSLHYDELEAINYLIKKMQYEKVGDN